MTTQQFWASNWVFWLYFSAWLPFTALALWYGFTRPRHKDAIGRSLLAVKASLSFVLTIVLTAFIWPGYEWRRALLVVGMTAVALAGWYQLSVWVRERRRSRLDRCPTPDRKES